MTFFQQIAETFHMTDAVWERHANPWSVWTRYAGLPLLILAIWSRGWLGLWAIAPVLQASNNASLGLQSRDGRAGLAQS